MGLSWRMQMSSHNSNVFVSYRHADSVAHTGRLVDALRNRYGDALEIFRDIESITPGASIEDTIEEKLRRTRILILVIGPRWLEALGPDSERHAGEESDAVRMELETAIRRMPQCRVQTSCLPVCRC